MKWRRYRFYTESVDDYKPILWPPPGPYWCSGELETHAILVAYIPEGVDLLEYWPEAEVDDFTIETEVTFSSRFPKPDWWEELEDQVKET